MRILSGSLIVLSMLGSLGSALETVQSYRGSLASQEPQAISSGRESLLRDLDRQTEVLIDRLQRLPADYSSASREINGELTRLREERKTLAGLGEGPPSEAHRTLAESSVFDLIAEVARVPTETVLLVVLLFLAANLEVAALVLAGHSQRIGLDSSKGPTRELPESHKAFLRVAMDCAPLPFLHGRDLTAQRLGIGFYEAKKIVADLKAWGVIEVRGKRLVLRQE